jgi:hypothetical protein
MSASHNPHLIYLNKCRDGAVVAAESMHHLEDKDDKFKVLTDASIKLLERMPCKCQPCMYYKINLIKHTARFHAMVRSASTPCSCAGCKNSYGRVFACNYPTAPKYKKCDRGSCWCSMHPVPFATYPCPCECHADAYKTA